RQPGVDVLVSGTAVLDRGAALAWDAARPERAGVCLRSLDSRGRPRQLAPDHPPPAPLGLRHRLDRRADDGAVPAPRGPAHRARRPAQRRHLPAAWPSDQGTFNAQGYGVDAGRGLLIFHRWGPTPGGAVERFIVVVNFSGQDQWGNIPFPTN